MIQPSAEIKKLQLHQTVKFAILSIPTVDRRTLETLLELVNVDGTHGSISQARLMAKMRLMLKYVPETCAPSLLILADLLELPISGRQAALQAPQADMMMPGISVAQLLQTITLDQVSG